MSVTLWCYGSNVTLIIFPVFLFLVFYFFLFVMIFIFSHYSWFLTHAMILLKISGGYIWLAYPHFTYAGSKTVHKDFWNTSCFFFLCYEMFILERHQDISCQTSSGIILSLNCWIRVKANWEPILNSPSIHFSPRVNLTKLRIGVISMGTHEL